MTFYEERVAANPTRFAAARKAAETKQQKRKAEFDKGVDEAIAEIRALNIPGPIGATIALTMRAVELQRQLPEEFADDDHVGQYEASIINELAEAFFKSLRFTDLRHYTGKLDKAALKALKRVEKKLGL